MGREGSRTYPLGMFAVDCGALSQEDFVAATARLLDNAGGAAEASRKASFTQKVLMPKA